MIFLIRGGVGGGGQVLKDNCEMILLMGCGATPKFF